jgi:hypothetical protein
VALVGGGPLRARRVFTATIYFARPSLREIDPKLQRLAFGQWVSMSPTPSERTAWTVDSFVQNE